MSYIALLVEYLYSDTLNKVNILGRCLNLHRHRRGKVSAAAAVKLHRHRRGKVSAAAAAAVKLCSINK